MCNSPPLYSLNKTTWFDRNITSRQVLCTVPFLPLNPWHTHNPNSCYAEHLQKLNYKFTQWLLVPCLSLKYCYFPHVHSTFSMLSFYTFFLWNFKYMDSISIQMMNTFQILTSPVLWPPTPIILLSTGQSLEEDPKEPQTQQIQARIIKSPPELTPSPVPYPREWHWYQLRIPRQKSISWSRCLLLHCPSLTKSSRQDYWFSPLFY